MPTQLKNLFAKPAAGVERTTVERTTYGVEKNTTDPKAPAKAAPKKKPTREDLNKLLADISANPSSAESQRAQATLLAKIVEVLPL